MILIFSLVFVFIWGYLKKFPRGNRLKMIFAVTVFSILVSLLVSFISVYGFHGAYDTDDFNLVHARRSPALARFSLPYYLERQENFYGIFPPDPSGSFRIYFADVQLWEMEFRFGANEGGLYIYPLGHRDVNYTTLLSYQLLVILIALNLLGAPLAAFTYVCVLNIWRFGKKIWEK